MVRDVPPKPTAPSKRVKKPEPLPHKLWLYEAAVQQPAAEVAFAERVYRRANGRAALPMTLREDFAGTASVAAAWCMSHPEREALAIEKHGPTLRWAQRRHGDVDGVHFVEADVMAVGSAIEVPRVDVTVSLNFSTFIWHDRAALVAYFRNVKRGLSRGGVFVMDAFGGPDAMKPGVQKRKADGFGYEWEQRSFNPVTGRIDCRIHFAWTDGRRRDDAFRYDWRLWGLAELCEAMAAAGLRKPTVWAGAGGGGGGNTPGGRFRPVARLSADDAASAWVVYVSAQR